MGKAIDFVILWVDGNDPAWQEERSRYSPEQNTDNRAQRYRDWDNLQYWFRGVEKFAPWVRKIHFVTWGHLPSWLDTKNPKLHIVNHRDFMPAEALPCFNSNALEMNLHRIKGLSEQFVYFNDDMFLVNKVKKSDFFKDGLPCDSAILNVHCYSEAVQFHFGYERSMGMINKYFDFHASIRKNWKKWFNPKYDLPKMLRSMVLLGCPRFPGLWQHHAPFTFLKSTYLELWEKEEVNLMETTMHRFRHMLDFPPAVFKSWQIAKGAFMPQSTRISKSFMIQEGQSCAQEVADAIRGQKYKMVTVNDGEMSDAEFEDGKERICRAFEAILSEKSSFEK